MSRNYTINEVKVVKLLIVEDNVLANEVLHDIFEYYTTVTPDLTLGGMRTYRFEAYSVCSRCDTVAALKKESFDIGIFDVDLSDGCYLCNHKRGEKYMDIFWDKFKNNICNSRISEAEFLEYSLRLFNERSGGLAYLYSGSNEDKLKELQKLGFKRYFTKPIRNIEKDFLKLIGDDLIEYYQSQWAWVKTITPLKNWLSGSPEVHTKNQGEIGFGWFTRI